MEPRGAVGDYNAADGRYTIYTPMQRPHPARAELAKMLKVPESKLRIVTGDTGGCFGMKSPIFNESPLVLLASKLTGRPVKWISTRTEAFLSDAQARDNVTEAELALDKDGVFLGMRVKTIAAIGAYLQHAMPAFMLNAGTLAGVYRTPAIHVDITGVFTNTNPVRPYRGNGRPEAAFVIERMVDLAAAEMGIDPAELRRRNYIPPSAMPFKTGLTFTYDCGEFEKNMDLALALADFKGFKARKAESRKARQAARLRPVQHHRARRRRRAPKAPKCASTAPARVTLFSGSNSQGQGHETVFKQIVCDRLGIDPDEVQYVQGDTDQVFFGEGTGGSRSATMAGSAFHMATEKIVDQGARHRRAYAQGRRQRSEIRRRRVLDAKTNRTLTIKEIAAASFDPANLPKGMEPGLIATADLYGAGQQLSERLPHLRSRDRPRDRQGRRSCATAWSTTSAPCSIRCCCTARSMAASRKAPAKR